MVCTMTFETGYLTLAPTGKCNGRADRYSSNRCLASRYAKVKPSSIPEAQPELGNPTPLFFPLLPFRVLRDQRVYTTRIQQKIIATASVSSRRPFTPPNPGHRQAGVAISFSSVTVGTDQPPSNAMWRRNPGLEVMLTIVRITRPCMFGYLISPSTDAFYHLTT